MASASPLTVLNINSDTEALYFSSRILRNAHFNVLEASNAHDALVQARQHPDLIVIDTRLFQEKNCGICRAIQPALSSPRIPVLHLVSDISDFTPDIACAPDLRTGKLRWPASASTLLTTVCDLLATPESTDNLGVQTAEQLGRLTLAASYQVDPQGIVIEWGAGSEHQFGWPSKEVLGRFVPMVGTAQLDEFLAMLSSVAHGQSVYHWETVRHTKLGQHLPVAVSMLPIFDDNGHIARIRIISANISEIKFLQNELQQLSTIILGSRDLICVIDKAGNIEFINPAGSQLLGLPSGKPPQGLHLENFLSANACRQIQQVAIPRATAGGAYLDELSIIGNTEEEIPVSVQIVSLSTEIPDRFAIIARDIQNLKRAEEKLLQLNRVHGVLGKCNQAIQQARNEKALYTSICHLLTDTGGHRFAMVSLMAPRAEQMMHPIAWSGDEPASASDFDTSWDNNHERGRGPTGTAVRTGQAVIRHDIGQAPECAPWQAVNERLGLHSVIALPLAYGSNCYGALSIYSTRVNIFDADEARLLQQLAHQLAYGIHTLRAEDARREAETQLRLFGGAIESTLDGVMITDAQRPDHPIVFTNPAFTRITGWEADEVIGQSGRILVAAELQQPEIEVIRHALRGRTTGQAVIRCFRKDGQPFWNELHVAPIRDAEQQVTHFVSVISDVSERIRHENQLSHLATHDPLTGLANRTLLNDRLEQAIARAQRDGRFVGVLLIDLDRFKEVNDTFGHNSGDLLLQTVANRLKGLALASDTVARLGGDEFVLLLTDLDNELDVPRTGHMLLEQLSIPLTIGAETLSITPSIGASIYPQHASDAENLLRLADTAMYEVKESGRNAFRCFGPEMDLRTRHQISLEKDLRHALERGQLLLHYQPKADLYSGNITGVEALIRWQHPERGLIPPTKFIPLAEASGLIVPIGSWVLHEACRQARQWQIEGFPPMRVAVNLSALQLRQENLVEQIERTLLETGLTPDWLELEVTESMVMENPETAAVLLGRLRQMGIRLAMDDFGTGYSSLGYLKRFPFDVLKIDRSFVQNIVSEPNDALIAVAVIAMAHSLGLEVIAEGVEDESQMRYLRSHLCDEIQGYLYSRPLPATELSAFLKNPPVLALTAEGSDRPERTLLVVDDEPDILNSLKRLLRRSGYRILTANSAAEGLELLAINMVQVIVSDQRMPVMSGSEFLSRVKALHPDTMRIVLSGYTELGALTDAINRGAIYKFVTKPWDDNELREVIREAFVAHEQKAEKSTRQASETGRKP